MEYQERQAIRQQAREQRRQLSSDQQHLHAIYAKELIANQPLFQLCQHVAFYLAVDGELNPRPLLELAIEQGKQCYLPIMHPCKQHQLLFMPFTPGDRLVKNCFGILEPAFDPERVVLPWCLELVFMPLVAFDDQGNRLGVGAGCYDRSFAFRQHSSAKKPLLIGLAHDFQRQESVAPQPWDVPLDAILTEQNLIMFT